MPPQAEEFRQVLGHFCTGVTVITTDGPHGPAGFACQAFAALSLAGGLLALALLPAIFAVRPPLLPPERVSPPPRARA